MIFACILDGGLCLLPIVFVLWAIKKLKRGTAK